jgi:hypothetical protein
VSAAADTALVMAVDLMAAASAPLLRRAEGAPER